MSLVFEMKQSVLLLCWVKIQLATWTNVSTMATSIDNKWCIRNRDKKELLRVMVILSTWIDNGFWRLLNRHCNGCCHIQWLNTIPVTLPRVILRWHRVPLHTSMPLIKVDWMLLFKNQNSERRSKCSCKVVIERISLKQLVILFGLVGKLWFKRRQ